MGYRNGGPSYGSRIFFQSEVLVLFFQMRYTSFCVKVELGLFKVLFLFFSCKLELIVE